MDKDKSNLNKSGKAYTTEEWVKMAKEKRPEFLYDNTIYENKNTDVVVTCKKHGDFKINPKYFLYNNGWCPECYREYQKENGYKKIRPILEDAYKELNYVFLWDTFKNAYSEMDVICPTHGLFHPNLRNMKFLHTICPDCAASLNGKNKRLSQDVFLERVEKIFANKNYDFSNAVYDGNDKEVEVVCPIHGVFKKTPHDLFNGSGCQKCAAKERGLKIRLSEEEYVERCKNVHIGKDYDYSECHYQTTNDDVVVICHKKDKYGNEHGPFTQSALMHMQGQGCPKCQSSHLEQEIRSFCILNNFVYEEQKKFPWLGRQSLDFYLPDFNIAIECQGKQHFINERRYKNLDKIRERDIRKRKLCKENNVILLYYTTKELIKLKPENDEEKYFVDFYNLKNEINLFKRHNDFDE